MAAQFFIDEFLFSSSDSTSSDDEHEVRGPTVVHPRVQNYIETVVYRYSDDEFRQNFHMNRTTFNFILNLIHENISTNIVDRGRHTISPETQLLVALWYFGTPDCYRSICSRFNIGKATALRTIRRVVEALVSLGPNFITWPSGDNLENVKAGFNDMGFPDTIGAIDGMYIPIPKPKEHGLSYICRKGFSCVTLQAVCDHTLKFTHCYAGEVGSTHDANVLRRSDIWTFINERANEKFPQDTHLVGDKAYPCLPQLITPYKDNGHLNNNQKNFNFLLSRTRSTVERSFNLLQKRWRRLKDLLDVISLEWIPKYIIACCILHNICIMQDDILEVDFTPNEDDGGEIGIPGEAERQRLYLGRQKRDVLCARINNIHV